MNIMFCNVKELKSNNDVHFYNDPKKKNRNLKGIGKEFKTSNLHSYNDRCYGD